MSNMRTRALTLAVTAAIALTSFSPSFAIQMPAAPAATAAVPADDVQQVQYWRHHGDGYYRGGGYRGRGYYGGYRGYDGYRHGYRYHNGYWFPLAAFGAGALIGGAIASDQPRVYARPSNGINPRHYEWCANRYRSYRGYDNTFQPNHGPRRQCLSPFY